MSSAAMRERPIVLVVEDFEPTAKMISAYCESAGYQAVRAATEREAVELAKRLKPDLVLLDLQLEQGDGLTVAEALAADEDTREIPIVVLSGLPAPRERDKAESAGCKDYLEKPFSLSDLAFRIQKWSRGN